MNIRAQNQGGKKLNLRAKNRLPTSKKPNFLTFPKLKVINGKKQSNFRARDATLGTGNAMLSRAVLLRLAFC